MIPKRLRLVSAEIVEDEDAVMNVVHWPWLGFDLGQFALEDEVRIGGVDDEVTALIGDQLAVSYGRSSKLLSVPWIGVTGELGVIEPAVMIAQGVCNRQLCLMKTINGRLPLWGRWVEHVVDGARHLASLEMADEQVAASNDEPDWLVVRMLA